MRGGDGREVREGMGRRGREEGEEKLEEGDGEGKKGNNHCYWEHIGKGDEENVYP